VRSSVVPGVSMRELCDAVDHEMVSLGALVPSFTTHIHTLGLADKRDSADPATATLPLRSGESVKFDFGAAFNGYCSDFGRTYFCGEPPSDFLEAYDVLMAAQAAAIAAARPGATAGSVDVACRAVIEEAGLGDYFVHRTGHCIGLDVHELPFISEEDQTPLEPGMTYTIEPSINVPQRFGMRIEDVVVTAVGGAHTLTNYPSDLIIVP
jgi:Xaa-Pro aminopeptidase